jgi:hypothetical protein
MIGGAQLLDCASPLALLGSAIGELLPHQRRKRREQLAASKPKSQNNSQTDQTLAPGRDSNLAETPGCGGNLWPVAGVLW